MCRPFSFAQSWFLRIAFSTLRALTVVIGLASILPWLACGGGGGGTPPSQPVSVAITSHPQSVTGGNTYTFVASVSNASNQAVTWSLGCPQGINDCGTINSTGVYTAPYVTTAITVSVKATSVADTTKSDSFTFQLMPATVAVQITTRPSVINAGLRYQFAATLTGTENTQVTWGLACSQGVSDCGSITTGGMYTAPATVAQQSPFTVTATSVADSTKSDSVNVSLFPAIAVSIHPGDVQVTQGFSYPFYASVENDFADVGVTWSVNGIPGGNTEVGTIQPVTDPNMLSRMQGIYTAPATAPTGPLIVTATSKVDTNKASSAAVELIANVHQNFSGDCAFLVSGPYGGSLQAAGGILTLDGAGHLTANVDIHVGDYQDTILPGLNMTGTYGFEGKNGGWAALSYSQAGQTLSMSFRFVFVSDTVIKVVEFDGQGVEAGTIEKQSSDVSGALEGKHVYSVRGFHINNNTNANETFAVVGQFTGTSGTLNGAYDLANKLITQPYPLSGWYTVSGKTGTANLGLKQGTGLQDSPDFFLYPVSSDRSLVLSKVSPALIGTIEKQSADTFSTTSLSGDWVFYYLSHTPTLQQATLGRFSTDGSGSEGPGCMDGNGSSLCYPIDLNSYSVAASGRGFAPSAQFVMPFPVVLYFVDAKRGYFGTTNGMGEFFRREGEPFTSSSLNGDYTVVLNETQDYFFNPKATNRTGMASLDGNGAVQMVTSWVDARNLAINPGYTQTGSYAFDPGGEGRGTLIFDVDNQYLYYTVSADKVLMIRMNYYDVAFGIMQRAVF